MAPNGVYNAKLWFIGLFQSERKAIRGGQNSP